MLRYCYRLEPIALPCNFVITLPEKLDQTKTMAERIRHEGYITPLVRSNGFFKLCPRRNRPLYGRLDFTDDKIKMQRRPVPRITAPLRRFIGCRRSRLFNQQKNRRRTSNHFDAECAQASPYFQIKCRTVKAGRFLEIINVNVYRKPHFGIAQMRWLTARIFPSLSLNHAVSACG